jgi:hypothetical protein
MHELEIPWEAHSFTDGTAFGDRHDDIASYAKISYVLKRLDQTWDNAKKWFGVANSALLGTYARLGDVFQSNYDEVNLHHIYERFKLCGHRDRLLIVMSDGATCGSTQTLTDLVKQITDEGTLVLGLGICNRNVEEIYPNHVTFTKMEDLAKLPEFFADMIVKLKKGDL